MLPCLWITEIWCNIYAPLPFELLEFYCTFNNKLKQENSDGTYMCYTINSIPWI